MSEKDNTIVEYDGDRGMEVNKRTITIYVDGKETVVEDVHFYDPIKGFIQTENLIYVPKGIIQKGN